MSNRISASRKSPRAIIMASASLLTSSMPYATAHAQASPDASKGSAKLESITITAERRSSTVQKTAASVSVRSGGELIKQGRRTLSQFLEDIPGISISPALGTGPGGLGQFPGQNPYANIVIRGVIPAGSNSTTTIPTTAVYVDGVYQGLGSDYDLSRVEVLRGPQGTLYGRSATGGVISLYSADPQLKKYGADLAATYGSYDLRDIQAAANIPIGDELALRVSGREYDQLGYINLRAGSQEKGEARAKLLYRPSDDLSVLLGFAFEENHSHQGGPNFELLSPGVLTPGSVAPVTPLESHQHQFWANVNWNVGFATLTYIPSFRKADYEEDLTYLEFPGQPPIATNPLFTPLDQTLTQEVRIASNGANKLQWIGGVFYFNSMYKGSNELTFIQSGATGFKEADRKFSQDTGVFGETTYAFRDTLRLTAGLRYDRTAIEHSETYTNNANLTQFPPFGPDYGLPEQLYSLSVTPSQGKDTFSNITYKVRLEDDLTPRNMVYALASSGFLPGDVEIANNTSGVPYAARYAEESLYSFELGSKNRFLQNTLQVNASGYYYLYGGYQTPINPTPQIPGSGQVILTVPAQMYGIDLEATYHFTPNDRFNLTLGAIKAEFTGNPTISQFGTSINFNEAIVKKDIADISPLTFTSAYDHTFAFANGSSLDARADMQLFGAYYQGTVSSLGYGSAAAGAAHVAATLPLVYLPYQLMGNLSATWTSPSGKYSIGGYIRNISNNVYVTLPGFSGPSPIAGGTPSLGRTAGATVQVRF